MTGKIHDLDLSSVPAGDSSNFHMDLAGPKSRNGRQWSMQGIAAK